MLKNYLIVAYRNLRRDGLYSLVNIAGLAVGMASCMLILLYVRHELSFDGFHRNADRIVRVVSTDYANQPPQLATMLVDQEPHVQQAVRIRTGGHPLLSAGEAQFHHRVHVADASLYAILDFDFVAGDARTALVAPHSMVISTDIAERFFGDEGALGKLVRWDTSHEHRITGVVEVPSNTHLPLDIVISMSTVEVEPAWRGYADLDSWHRDRYGDYYTYLLLDEPESAAGLEQRVLRLLEGGSGREYLVELKEAGETLHIQPLRDIHLHSDLGLELKSNGDITHVYIMSAIAAFLLIIACTNSVNLATARALGRAREVGIRKAVGAQKGQLVGQFLGESTLTVLAAGTVALGLLWAALPAFSAFVGIAFVLAPDRNPQPLVAFVAMAAGTAALCGLYPALALSAFEPARALRTAVSSGEGGAFLRRRLVEFQFGTSVALIAVALIVYNQFDYARSKRLGFEKEQILYYRTGYPGIRDRAEAIKNALEQCAGVVATARFSQIPFAASYSPQHDARVKDVGQAVDMSWLFVDEDFIDLFAMNLVAGRNVRMGTQGEVIINERAARSLGFADPRQAVGRSIDVAHWPEEETIVGVVEDFHFESIRQRIGPVALHGPGRGYYVFTAVKVHPANMRQTLAALRDTWKRFAPEYPFDYRFLDSDFEELYRGEERLAHILGVFATLAVAIACMGAFALGLHAVERRSKEIGVRKVLGATARDIVFLLSGQFTGLVLRANLVAWPIAYLAMDRWLDQFAYRQNPGLLVFLASGLSVLIVAWLTVGGQSLRTALRSPVQALRQE